MVAHQRLNQAIASMGPYTLRETDVNPAALRAVQMMRAPLVDARLGDPCVFGFNPFPKFQQYAVEALRNPLSWRYNDARGRPKLREVLGKGNPQFGNNGYEISPDKVFVGPGISGVARALFTTIIRGTEDEVLIPKWSYILYLAEAGLSKARVQNLNLNEDGQIDITHLKRNIRPGTKAVFLTSVGNPLGVAMSREILAKIINVINEKETEFKHPIYLVVDTIYEDFRRNGPALDPIAVSKEVGRHGPTIEMYSVSKMMAAPGARVGWMRIYHDGEKFKSEIDAMVEALRTQFQPGLGQSSQAYQMALERLYSEFLEHGREEFDAFRAGRREEVARRVKTYWEALAGIDGVVFPHYYQGGPASIHSFYILFGVDYNILKREDTELSSARRLADFMIDGKGPVLLSTPGDSFLEAGLRGRSQEYMRVVALLPEQFYVLANNHVGDTISLSDSTIDEGRLVLAPNGNMLVQDLRVHGGTQDAQLIPLTISDVTRGIGDFIASLR
jgi:aspartate/methionine/tyrosine aminotransferase